MTGVLFVEDDTPDALVAKPGREPVPQTILAHVMHEKAGRGKVKTPAIRPADSRDRAGLAWVIDNVLELEPGAGGIEEKERIKRLFRDSPAVFIMGRAKGKDFKTLARERPAVARGLLTSPDYVKRLGIVTAVDLFLGNRDRLDAANLGNWMTAISDIDSMITLIDNFDPAGTQRLDADSQLM